jgi:hypothetical protein
METVTTLLLREEMKKGLSIYKCDFACERGRGRVKEHHK